MFTWLTENREWVFSGIGVVLISFFISYLYRFNKDRQIGSTSIEGQHINSAGRDIIIHQHSQAYSDLSNKKSTQKKQSAAFVYKKHLC